MRADEAFAVGLVGGSALLFGIHLVPWIRHEMRMPEPPDLPSSTVDELAASIFFFIALGFSIDMTVDVVEKVGEDDWSFLRP